MSQHFDGVDVAVIPTSHLDLFWLGDYRNCLRRGDEVIGSYLERAAETDETFVIDTVIFAEHFLRTHPQQEPLVRRLLDEGRLEIGSAYIDRWENLVLGESLIRNVQIGRRWLREHLDFDSGMAAHPDLPGLNAQTSQIYAQAGLRSYVTSRKIFHEGRVWAHRAPDGTELTMLSWPIHYVFTSFEGMPDDERAAGSFTAHQRVTDADLSGRYPLGVVAVPGSAGDLTTPEDFLDRYGRSLQEVVDRHRAQFPATTFSYTVPSAVLDPYAADRSGLAVVRGTIPSVWGVAPDEEMRFFHRVRRNEHLLLSAETASALGRRHGLPALPETASAWRGLFAEDAFFADDDHPPAGREWEWLWRMHVFTQDHNGGGQDGPLSVFEKVVRHDRTRGYVSEVVEHALGDPAGEPAVLHVRLGESDRLLRLPADTSAALAPWLARQPGDLWQPILDADGRLVTAVSTEQLRGVGHRPLRLERTSPASVRTVETDDSFVLRSPTLLLTVPKATGAADLVDHVSGETWHLFGDGLAAVPELGNDVTLATDESRREASHLVAARLATAGPLAAQVELVVRLLDVEWHVTLTLWADEARLTVDVRTAWPGLTDWQVRLPLLTGVPREDVALGTAFHGSSWTDVDPRARSLMPDEISEDDFEHYRETQHWLHVRGGSAGLAILTEHPAFHDRGDLDAVLLRTAASCGEPRMHWTNAGSNTWTFDLRPVAATWLDAAMGELGDRAWRQPTVVLRGRVDAVQLLDNEGDPAVLSACALEDDRLLVRLVNQSDVAASAHLVGDGVAGGADLVDLAGRVVGSLATSGSGLDVELPAWRIQTVILREK